MGIRGLFDFVKSLQWFRYLKTGIMVLLVGSSIVFSSMSVQTALNQTGDTINNSDNYLTHSIFEEVQVLIFILSSLGVAVFVLVFALQKISGIKEKDFLNNILTTTGSFALV